MSRRDVVVAPPTTEWVAFVEHVAGREHAAGCEICRASQPCDEGRRLLRRHLAVQRSTRSGS